MMKRYAPPVLRAVKQTDLDQVAEIHRQAFPGFLMTLLGPVFLREYYQTVLDYPDRVFLVALDERESVVGFIAGFYNPGIFYRLLGSRRKRMMSAAVLHLVLRPRLWLRVRENMKQIGERSGESLETCGRVELASVGVAPYLLHQGCGRALVSEFLARCSKFRAGAVELTTDAMGNTKVNRFYQSLGFRVVKTSERSGGRRMNHYEYVL
ncbi:GNAT family N-acetyltransferase [Aromatoleum petrolei]|uniref:GNAT family N-acetyltransferase n=1 Tax=Aromatoleum petrolei TaxID=76116 RepID=A0ABX1MZV6_9RHOO|nr:GNAT family N-acetyltransferase [Aromatoleum petrolei]NMF90642.1 GNAT family N-acetyltransferase [Aromatoleum petrolei]QTQ35896.1 Acetyltransferase (GNAT) domain-containing protein [Aromatoleum petrolei]